MSIVENSQNIGYNKNIYELIEYLRNNGVDVQ